MIYYGTTPEWVIMYQQLHLSSDIGLSLDVASKYALDMIRCF